mmetsp:Transcript_25364/g.59385  ORF Transcript_25364/g.59385 Transcript_25364/m.59385 type:complete len:207 (+) Transcript_25364:797-1417(+)
MEIPLLVAPLPDDHGNDGVDGNRRRHQEARGVHQHEDPRHAGQLRVPAGAGRSGGHLPQQEPVEQGALHVRTREDRHRGHGLHPGSLARRRRRPPSRLRHRQDQQDHPKSSQGLLEDPDGHRVGEFLVRPVRNAQTAPAGTASLRYPLGHFDAPDADLMRIRGHRMMAMSEHQKENRTRNREIQISYFRRSSLGNRYKFRRIHRTN